MTEKGEKTVNVGFRYSHLIPGKGRKYYDSKPALKFLGFSDIKKNKREPYLNATLPVGWALKGDVDFQGGSVEFIDEKGVVKFTQWAKCYDNMFMYGDGMNLELIGDKLNVK